MDGINIMLKDLTAFKSQGYWADRIISQLEYVRETTKYSKGVYDTLLSQAADFVVKKNEAEGVITKKTVLECEKMMAPLTDLVKKNTLICVAHAHIDMNWMWRFDETVAIALDTFRTMLDLMDEYPTFCFSQSQASVYKIVEEYDPEMLARIKKRVKEGRWEVTASTWVEADKNMPSGESKARHILYTKRYLSKLLGITKESLDIDYEPDTFGHDVNGPETLVKGGIKYYYHARALNGIAAYRWQSPSGATVLVYNDPTHYNGNISTWPVLLVPGFTHDVKHNTMMYVYGVGDHGGGPSRRDIEKILDMNTWPLFPNIKCGTYREFFHTLEKISDTLPVVKDELNYIFTGCYTTQTRIKNANRISEAALGEAESFSAIRSLNDGTAYKQDTFAEAWKKVLFNQFHDILTGSGKIDTREYAMGEFQKAFAVANIGRSTAMRAIAANIDTSAYMESGRKKYKDTDAEGAGAAYGICDFKVSQVSRGAGAKRIFTVFNPSPFDRTGNVEIDVWDWNGRLDSIVFKDEKGIVAAHQMISDKPSKFWSQQYFTLLLEATVPALGYSTYIMMADEDYQLRYPYVPENRTIDFPEYVLENENIRVSFDPVNASITSFKDKKTGKDYCDANRPAGIFRYIEESTKRRMTSWIVGPYMNIQDITGNVVIGKYTAGPDLLRQSIEYKAEFANSELNVVIYLDRSGTKLVYDVTCEWREMGKPNVKIPQLNFFMPLPYQCSSYKYDVPFGTYTRGDANDDRPANSFVLGVNPDSKAKSLMVAVNNKYGFRTQEDSIAVTCIRGSYDPDPYPEIGIHRFVISVDLAEDSTNRKLIERASVINHDMSVVSVKPGKGELPFKKGFIEFSDKGTAALSGIKMAEDGQGMIIRLYETDGRSSVSSVTFFKKVTKAYLVDLNEKPMENGNVTVDGNKVSVKIEPYSICAVCAEF